MSLINTVHMAEGEERFTGARNAPITDGSHCCPIIPFCARPPVFVGFSSSLLRSSFQLMKPNPLRPVLGKVTFVREMWDTSEAVEFTV